LPAGRTEFAGDSEFAVEDAVGGEVADCDDKRLIRSSASSNPLEDGLGGGKGLLTGRPKGVDG